jgi:hypothetical protein
LWIAALVSSARSTVSTSRFKLGDIDGLGDYAIAPDGRLWLLMDAEQGGLYVITPVAVAGIEPKIDDSLDKDALMTP